MKLRTISLPDELDAQAFAAAQRDGRTYSNWARQVIERAVANSSGEPRLSEPQVFADSAGPKMK
jgi:hypothetical protein